MDFAQMSDDHSDDRPIAPSTLYKYVVADRIDVLRNANIRFTPPLNTNDIFEVRQTFEMLAGPKMQDLFAVQAEMLDMEETILSAVKDTPLAGMSPDALMKLFKSATGTDLEATLQTTLSTMLNDTIFPAMNSPQAIDRLLTKLGRDLICLSLTERFDSSPMWAHAHNSTGFVIAFNTENSFFRRGDLGERQGLQKIKYFNGKITEVMDDPYAALMSKQKDWAYEREWRLYLTAAQASKTVTVGEEAIHLVDFPSQAVQRVVLGLRASEELESSLKSILADSYSHAQLTRVSADFASASLIETPVA
ncbi:MAG: DUF2971 domain-containing protein [Sphingomonas sp.]|uniref:DUF2971 domain-containing protein n=1 Tax=Sphingomonas sp. TaxID=28214 RepID=UPI0011F7A9D5|nr:DUF2971 domain-containing protein [Sphingomonas sp.]THD37750.1 MAG: DUF2971 domain-containing protein [Sphingomonas sp.]